MNDLCFLSFPLSFMMAIQLCITYWLFKRSTSLDGSHWLLIRLTGFFSEFEGRKPFLFPLCWNYQERDLIWTTLEVWKIRSLRERVKMTKKKRRGRRKQEGGNQKPSILGLNHILRSVFIFSLKPEVAKQVTFDIFANSVTFMLHSPDKPEALWCPACCYATLMTTVISFSPDWAFFCCSCSEGVNYF